jgi:hypothetical protein
MDEDKEARKLAKARLKLKVATSNQNLLKEVDDPNEEVARLKKLGKANDTITNIVSTFLTTKKPIKKTNLKKVVDLSRKFKILLTYEAIKALYGNRQNVSQYFSYFDERIISLFEKLGYVRSKGDDNIFKVELMNTLVKIKKGLLKIPDDKVKSTKLFLDFNSVLEASKIYIWHTKVMECEPINNLDDEELKIRYSKIQARICKIVNQPIKEPIEPEEKEKTGTGVEEADDDIETGRKSKDDDDEKGDSEKDDDEKGDSEKDDDEKSDDEKSDDEKSDDDGDKDDEKSDDDGDKDDEKSDDKKSDDEGAKDEEKTEEFTQNIMNSSSNINIYFTNSDYNYIIGTSLFIFILFFIYLRYKNK